jgi:S1-C subfamily serine protease
MLRQFRDEVRQLVDNTIRATARVEVTSTSLQTSSGSAWLVADSLWVTNHHVVEDSGGRCSLTNMDQSIGAAVVGSDPDTDLAVLRADTSSPGTPLALRGAPVGLGEVCFTFGSPLGLFPDSVTMGIISGLERRDKSPSGRTIEGLLQTDAALNHGNSGGPLLDVFAQVIGVCCSGIDSADNLAFAIPAATVATIVPELIEHGRVVRSSLGIGLEAASVGSYREQLGVVRVADATSPFKVGDVLLNVGGRQIHRRADLFTTMNRSLIGARVPVEVDRDGNRIQFEVVPFERPEQQGA